MVIDKGDVFECVLEESFHILNPGI